MMILSNKILFPFDFQIFNYLDSNYGNPSNSQGGNNNQDQGDNNQGGN